MEEKGKKGLMDYTLLLIVVLLVVIGLVILYSTSAYNGQVKFHDSFYYLKKQAFATVLGIVLMLFVAGMDYHIWQRLACIWLSGSSCTFGCGHVVWQRN